MQKNNQKTRRQKLKLLVNSLRFRLTLLFTATLAVVLLVFGVFVYTAVASSVNSTLDLQLREQAQQLITEVNPITRFTTRFIQLQGQNNNPITTNDSDLVLVLSTDNRILQKGGLLTTEDINKVVAFVKIPDNSNGLYTDYSPTNSQIENYRLYITPVIFINRRVGTVVVGRRRDSVHTLQLLMLVLLVAAPFTLLLAAGGGFWLASRTMRPVQEITRTAQEISETDLRRRLNLKRRDEMGELAATFDAMLARLESAFLRQRQFTADASHELRTPLTIVNLEVNRALAHRRTFEEYERVLGVVQSENEYMSRLVGDLLTLARAEVGQTLLHLENLDLSDIALEVCERLSPLARQNNLELVTGELPELKLNGDRFYLTQMLTNLVENAIKYTSGVGNRVLVEAGCEIVNKIEQEWVRVEDDGPGIASEHLPHLFERFYRIDKARSQNWGNELEISEVEDAPTGSGLGLAIGQWVAQAHGGEIRVKSSPGKGSVFEVRLPIQKNSLIYQTS